MRVSGHEESGETECTYQEKEVSFFTSCFNFFGRGFTSGLRKEHSSTSLGSTLSTSSAGLSDTIGNPVFEEKKLSSDVTNADMRQKNLCLCPNRRNQTIPHHRVLWQLRIAKGRENWDLNTTIDAWDEGTDASSVKTSIDGLNITHSAHDEKQLMSPTGMTSPTSVISVMQARKESQNKAFITSPGLHGQQYKCVDSRVMSFVLFSEKYTKMGYECVPQKTSLCWSKIWAQILLTRLLHNSNLFTRSNEGSSHIFRDCLNKTRVPLAEERI
ncbi:unnamed protein product [Vicia faba]|uniref:Uncharacterized protein n=1 Tax=Vicia faba TaxID=3906 RepID=A0AAV1ARU2_VICFA|nr:unnamed protein product [Vicia faba]